MELDHQLVQRAIAGDERAMRLLWSRHSPHIDAVVRRLVGDPDLAADIAQDVWIQIFRALPGYRGDSQFGTWAHRIAVNRTLNALRKVRRLAKIEVDIEDDSASVDQDGERTLLAQTIEEATKKLSPGAREVFLLHDVQ
jgi:RNA polymerase sigma-70 factor (ECF subfamily)